MTGRYLQNHFTPEVLEAQEHYYGRSRQITPQSERDLLTEEEVAFIAQRDSFYMATVASNGWPYVQHRGGPRGFLKVIEPNVLAFPDYQGNRQLLSTGNIASNNRVALFLIDYPRRERLKLMGFARAEDAREHPELVSQLAETEAQRIVERLFFIDVVSFNWNCPKYITPRYTSEEIQEIVAPLKARIAELEAKLKASND
jgi:predicted pyridoxine 5'-phosphate oxidase superfamily flavin-nucleotide-binding protein